MGRPDIATESSPREGADSRPIHPFRVEVPQPSLDDLRGRLAHTRWPDELPGVAWDLGVPLAYLKDLAEYWRTAYDWRVHEAEINRFPQFTTTVDGQRLHFIHLRSADPAATPLLVLHGWPGSIVELLPILGPLADPEGNGGGPAAAFHVVAPSLPGFGFSGPTREAGWDVARIARALAVLMERLGYGRYGAHGGDWGAAIARELGRTHPDRLVGVHLTMLSSAVATEQPTPEEAAALTRAERQAVTASFRRRTRSIREEMAFGFLQASRPQTLAYSLTDSPVGQLAWIVDKFKAWTDHAEVPDDAVDRDQMLTNVTVYWLTGTANSSARIYWETAHAGWGSQAEPSTVPTGVAVFPRDASLPVRHLAERTDSIVHWTEMDRGGHFPGMEVPDLLVADIRAFFQGLP